MNFLRCKRYSAVGTMTAVLLALPPGAWPHGYAGKRIFPTTLAIDDPFVMDELSLLASHSKEPGVGDAPAILATAISEEYTARITPHFGMLLGSEFRHLEPDGKDALDGFGNLEIGAKYQFLTNATHEAIASIGLEAEVGGTGDRRAGAVPFSTLSPQLFFGKGIGDLPESAKYLRPLAVTGILSAAFPTADRTVALRTRETGAIEKETARNPTTLHWGIAVQYSLQYLQSVVCDVGLKAPFSEMIPVVEFAMQTCLNAPCQGQTTGTINPGVIWFGRYV
ncbi:hypothetical protein EVC37_22010 [Methylocaldum sp. BRCS4]|jgi:hypothetical protein|nr:hypothetical protein [Methylocaldum sp. BRCS4]